MSFAFTIQAISPSSASSVPHILGFSTARSTTDDILLDVWNGSTNAARAWKVDKDGRTIGGDGTVAKPAFSFDDDADCGMYRIGSNNVGIAVGGSKIIDIGASSTTVSGTLINLDFIGSVFRRSTSDGSDNSVLQLTGGGAVGSNRGADINLHGNEHTSPGLLHLRAGNVTNAEIRFSTADTERGSMSHAGVFEWLGASTLTGAVTLGSTIRLPNATALLGRNAADSADVTMMLLSASDVITLGALTSGAVAIVAGSSDAVTIQAGGASKAIEVAGNAGQPTLGFYGAEVVAQQAVSGATADAALDDLLSALATLGLIVDNTTFTP